MAEMILLALFALVIAVVWVSITSSISSTVGGVNDKKVLDCSLLDEPHKWSYNKDDRLQCTQCNMIAGSYSSEGGDYNGM
jgi:hypothetical protein